MWEYSYNNHVNDSGSGSTWISKLGKCTREPLSFKTECINSARYICSQTNKDVYILSSGGRDSLFVINCFNEANVKFKIAIMDWGKLNEHDTKHAKILCMQLGLDYTLIPFDILSFINSDELYLRAKENNCWAHQILPLLEVIKQIDGIPIVCNGDPFFVNFSKQRFWYDLEVLHVIRKWMINNSITGIPEFFKYTPEQILSFSKELKLDNESRQIKYNLYNEYFDFSVSEKYDGWEIIQKNYPKLMNKLLGQMEEIKLSYNGVYLVEKKLLEKSISCQA